MALFDRREFLALSASFCASLGVGGCSSIDKSARIDNNNDDSKNWLKEFGFSDPEVEANSFGTQVGTAPPKAGEVTKAFKLLFNAPRGGMVKPIDVGRYFEAIKDKNANGELYNTEWKDRYNPVIVGFFP